MPDAGPHPEKEEDRAEDGGNGRGRKDAGTAEAKARLLFRLLSLDGSLVTREHFKQISLSLRTTAIQIAQAVGAEVFATAGSDEKRDFLRSLGVEHVMNSRTLDFADEIMEITSGEGVDVVLNSLPGEAIPKSLSILSAYGRFLEIGKTDIYQDRRIGLWPFQDNLSYFAIDLDRMLRQRPAEIEEMYRELMPLFEQGQYRPLPLKSL